MKIDKKGKIFKITQLEEFDIKQTLECGQCFHFRKIDESEYVVVHRKKLLRIKQDKSEILFENTSEEEIINIWADYFDINRDYKKIQTKLINADERLREAIEENSGVRILNQDLNETLMSFIISQNKQIPHIKKIVKELSEKYGDYLGSINGEDFYAFPDVIQLKNITEENYRECKTGFRAKYLADAASKIIEGYIREDELKSIGYLAAKEKLTTIKGVGDKVANCVLLFSLGYRNAFPVDVWIKRIMENMYFEGSVKNEEIMKFAKEKFGNYGGYAQQYLFYYAREKKIRK